MGMSHLTESFLDDLDDLITSDNYTDNEQSDHGHADFSNLNHDNTELDNTKNLISQGNDLMNDDSKSPQRISEFILKVDKDLLNSTDKIKRIYDLYFPELRSLVDNEV